MNKEPITAEEYLANHCIKPKIILNTGGDGFDLARLMHEYAILFAKHHCKEIIKDIHQDAMIVLAESLPEGHIHEEDYQRLRRNIEQSILNVSPESLIK